MSAAFERFIRETQELGFEQSAGRFYSIYRGEVVDNVDSEGMGRIKVKLTLLNDEPSLAQLAIPVMPFGGPGYGFFFPPYVGDPVYILFEHGDPDTPYYMGGYWTSITGTTPLPTEISNRQQPTTRLIKTKIGHALIFEDEGPVKKVELRTGENLTERLHYLLLDDTNEMIVLETAGGYFLSMSDMADVARFYAAGYKLELNEGLQKILLTTPDMRSLEINDQTQLVELTNKLGSKLTINEATGLTEMISKTGAKVSISDNAQTITTQDVLGNLVMTSPAGVTVTSAAAVNVTAAAAVNIVGSGITNTSSGPFTSFGVGASTSLFVGSVASIIVGAFSAILLGATTLTSIGVFTLIGTVILLGGPAARKLVDERILLWLSTHTHTAPPLGGPTSPPIQAPALSVPGSYTTTKTLAE